MKVIIKLPYKDGYWRLKIAGIEGRRYVSASGLLGGVKRFLLGTEIEKKTAIVTKRCLGTSQETLNETLASNNPNYLMYTTTCFLEDFISPETMRVAESNWLKFLEEGGSET